MGKPGQGWREAQPTYDLKVGASERLEAAWMEGRITYAEREVGLDSVWGDCTNGFIEDLVNGLDAKEMRNR